MDAAQELIELMRGLNYEFGQTYVLATESEEIAAMCDRIVRIDAGKVTADTGLPIASSNDENPDPQTSEES